MRAYRRYSRRGFTLVELMIVIAIIGVLATLAIVGYSQLMGTAKSGEARRNIGALSNAVQSAFERSKGPQELLDPGGKSQAISKVLCASAANKVPADMPGKSKVQPKIEDNQDFKTGDAVTGWKCLGFEINDPIQYQYSYTRDNAPVSGIALKGDSGFEAAAQGDVDGDAVLSEFALTGYVTQGTLIRATQLHVENESE